MRHSCNAYCSEAEHCDLVYTDRKAREGHIAQAYGYHHGVRVTRAEPAREAPPLAAQPPGSFEALTVGSEPPDAQRWLIWWQDA